MKTYAPLAVIGLVIVGALGFLLFRGSTDQPQDRDIINVDSTNVGTVSASEPSAELRAQFDDVDFAQSLIDYDKVFSGGPPRDGIPALTDPNFDALNTATIPGESLGIFIQHDGEKRFYPYTVLVWHEIVNDSIGDLEFAATFCPLCGSAIVFDRNVNGELKEFGVSGFLFESNMIMYDRTDTPSLWSQARAEAVIGDQAGTQLEILDFQLLTLDDVRNLHPDSAILSEDTGFSRNYGFDPYSGYEDNDDTIFPVTVDDTRHSAKEVFFIVPQAERSVAIQIGNVERGESADNSDLGLSVEKTSDGEVIVTNSEGETQPGYYEMWFSWAQHHQDDGDVWSI